MAGENGNQPAAEEPQLLIRVPKTARFVIVMFEGDSAAGLGYQEGPAEQGQDLLPVQLAAAARLLDEKAGMVFRGMLKPEASRIVRPVG